VDLNGGAVGMAKFKNYSGRRYGRLVAAWFVESHNRRYAAANLWVGRSNSQTTINALTTFQIRPLRNAAR
jgi:hypothetical protein